MSGEMIDLRNDAEKVAIVQQGESCNILGGFHIGGVSIVKASLIEAYVTLYDEKSDKIINDRLNQDMFDANGHTISDTGEFTLRFDEADGIILDDELQDRSYEAHIARVEWKWNDGTKDRKGKQELRFQVQKLSVPVS